MKGICGSECYVQSSVLEYICHSSYLWINPQIRTMAKFKREVIRCADENGNPKAAAIFGVDKSNVRLWRKHKAAIRGCEASRRKFTGPTKGRVP